MYGWWRDDWFVMETSAISVPLDPEEVAADVPQPPSGFVTAALRCDGGWSTVTERENDFIIHYKKKRFLSNQ